MPRELAVELIELLAGARVDYASQRQVLALARRPHFHGRAVEVWDVAQHDIEHQLREAVFGAAHDLDRERARKFEQRFGHGLFHRSNMGADMSRASACASATGDTCTRGSADAADARRAMACRRAAGRSTASRARMRAPGLPGKSARCGIFPRRLLCE